MGPVKGPVLFDKESIADQWYDKGDFRSMGLKNLSVNRETLTERF